MNRRPYAGEITKEYLQQKLGIEYVAPDGTEVIRHGKSIKINVDKNAKKQYGKLSFHDPDLYAAVPKEEKTNASGKVTIDIHVLNYVWNKQTKPAGMVIDHIDNDPTNNDISNLQCITQAENLAKERDNWHTWEIKCNLNKPRSHFEDKLRGYEMAYEQAKKDKDAEAAHKLRSNISQVRARLRYYDSHIEEATAKRLAKEEKEAKKKAYHERAQKKKELQANIDSARKYYKEALAYYGSKDPYVKKCWGEWKMAIAMLHGFRAENESGA